MVHRVLLVNIIIKPEIWGVLHWTSLEEVAGSYVFMFVWILNHRTRIHVIKFLVRP